MRTRLPTHSERPTEYQAGLRLPSHGGESSSSASRIPPEVIDLTKCSDDSDHKASDRKRKARPMNLDSSNTDTKPQKKLKKSARKSARKGREQLTRHHVERRSERISVTTSKSGNTTSRETSVTRETVYMSRSERSTRNAKPQYHEHPSDSEMEIDDEAQASSSSAAPKKTEAPKRKRDDSDVGKKEEKRRKDVSSSRNTLSETEKECIDFHNRAQFLERKGNIKDAVKLYQKAALRDYGLSLYNLACIYKESEDPEKQINSMYYFREAAQAMYGKAPRGWYDYALMRMERENKKAEKDADYREVVTSFFNYLGVKDQTKEGFKTWVKNLTDESFPDKEEKEFQLSAIMELGHILGEGSWTKQKEFKLARTVYKKLSELGNFEGRLRYLESLIEEYNFMFEGSFDLYHEIYRNNTQLLRDIISNKVTTPENLQSLFDKIQTDVDKVLRQSSADSEM